MNQKLLQTVLTAFLATITAVCLCACSPTGGTGVPPTGETAPSSAQNAPVPDFTVYDIDGNPVKLSAFHGKPVVLNFWASWCGPCRQEMPDFDEAYAIYGEDVHFLIVNLTDGTQETVASASAFLQSAGYSFPVYYDIAKEAATAYGIYSIPTTYFINAEGYAVARGVGMLDMEALKKGIGMILP